MHVSGFKGLSTPSSHVMTYLGRLFERIFHLLSGGDVVYAKQHTQSAGTQVFQTPHLCSLQYGSRAV